jgi:hypothetical protein
MPRKISQLEAATDVTASDLIQIVDIEDTGMAVSGTNKKCTAQLMANELGKLTNITATGSNTARSLANRFSDVVNVKDFGAKGDGVTDDTAAIQAAINFGSANKKSVLIPSGIFKVIGNRAAGALTIPVAGLTLYGCGGFNSILKTTGEYGILAATDANKIELDGVGFEGENVGRVEWQWGMMFRGVLMANIKNCRFFGLGQTAIMLAKTGFGGSDSVPNGSRQCEKVTIESNDFESCAGAIGTKYVGVNDLVINANRIKNVTSVGIALESEQSPSSITTEFADRQVVTNNVIDGVIGDSLTNIAWGITLTERCRLSIVSNNTITNVVGITISAGILISTSPAQDDSLVETFSVSGNVISSCTSTSGRGHGILLTAGDSNVNYVSVVGNTIKGCFNGFTIANDGGSKTLGQVIGGSFVGNVVSECSDNGVWTDTTSGSGGIALKGWTISGNTLIKNGASGIAIKAEGCPISSNNCIENTNAGIFISSGSGAGNVISGNSCTGNSDSGIVANGDHLLIHGNSCVNNGNVTATSYGIYAQSGSFTVVVDNNCSDTQTIKTQEWGIRAPSGSTVRENQLIGNATGSIWAGIANYNTGTYDAGLNRTA